MFCVYVLVLSLWVESPLAECQQHLARGRYEEASELLEAWLEKHPEDADAWLIYSRALRSAGQFDAALEALDRALVQQPEHPELELYRARLLSERGAWQEVVAGCQRVLRQRPAHPGARYLAAEVALEQGKLAEAMRGWQDLVRYYNRQPPRQLEELLAVAEGAAQYARWQGVPQIFDVLVNRWRREVLRIAPDAWEVHELVARLLAEKGNYAEASREIQRGLAINPHAAPLHLTLARISEMQGRTEEALAAYRRALELDPHAQAAWLGLCEIWGQRGDLPQVRDALTRAWQLNPKHQNLVAWMVFHGLQQMGTGRVEALEQLVVRGDAPPAPPLALPDDPWQWSWQEHLQQLLQRNPQPIPFWMTLAELCEQQRLWDEAEFSYQQVLSRQTGHPAAQARLGALYLHTGRFAQAQQSLQAAFRADPYQVRVSNLRKVLTLLDGYATLQTEHFVIHYDRGQDEIVARWMAWELEPLNTELSQRFGSAPASQTHIEVYNAARGISGHEWFSARMTGLPWLQTIGASTGVIVALTSPQATDTPYNWYRTLRHELTHVLTLQQTAFNIPHWFTEALATRAEGYPVPVRWYPLLISRVAEHRLWPITQLHLGFQQARSREDWNFAYCQSVLLAEYLLSRFGNDALDRLLHSYRQTRDVSTAFQLAWNVSVPEVEEGFAIFARERAALWKQRILQPGQFENPMQPTDSLSDDHPTVLAQRAWRLFQENKYEDAEQLARQAWADGSRPVWAAITLAYLAQRRGSLPAARMWLQQAGAGSDPPVGLALFHEAVLLLEHGEQAEALQLFVRGMRCYPEELTWARQVQRLAGEMQDLPLMAEACRIVATHDPDDLSARLWLAQYHAERKDYEQTRRWCREVVHIDGYQPEVYAWWVDASRALHKTAELLHLYGVWLLLEPDQEHVVISAAETAQSAGEVGRARRWLEEYLQKHPHSEVVQKRLQQLHP
ncbi:MAG: hypothetical protein KatS3mg113_0542 [Planctomycetaceae bacterium]|nr:MAG: hypothetical protein KatS3mg113_0542 [Planctomycetaceae bacterium]